MKEDDLSIRATLAAFPEDDPKNHQRHDLLVEASLAAPPLHPDQATAPSPPPHYLARAKNSPRRARLLDLFIAILALTLFWTQIISPAAQRDIRTVVSLSREQSLSWRDRLPIPEALIYFDPNEAIAEKFKTRIPLTKPLPLSDIFAIILLCFSTQRKIHIVTLLRSLTPCLAAFPLIFTLMAAESHRGEIAHVSQNTFERIGPESALGINRIERENSEFLRSTILQFLETAPSP